MVKYNLHQNGWTVFVDADLTKATENDIMDIAKLCATYTCVKIRNQDLSVDQEVKIIKNFKNPYQLYKPGQDRFEHYALDPEGFICRVTGKLNDKGHQGIAGHKSEMVWHHEHPAVRGQSSVAYLYAKENTKGSTTIWNNTVNAYNDLDTETKEKIQNLKVITFGGVTYSVEKFEQSFANRKIYDISTPLVYTNNAGKTGLHFSLFQFERFEGMSREESLEIAEPLFKFITQEKYCYYHEWNDGDVSFSDQWLGIHKRLEFNGMSERIVHRATFDYPDNLF